MNSMKFKLICSSSLQTVMEGKERLLCDPEFEGKGYYLAVGGAAALQNWAHIMKEIRKQNWDVSLTDKTDDMAMLSVQGPNSRAILEKLSDADFSNKAFPFSTCQLITVAGHKVSALRVSFVGEMGM